MQNIEQLRSQVVQKTPNKVKVVLEIEYELDANFTVIDALNHVEEVADKAREFGAPSGTGTYGEHQFKID